MIKVGWLIVGDGKAGERNSKDGIMETDERLLSYWKIRGYRCLPLYTYLDDDVVDVDNEKIDT